MASSEKKIDDIEIKVIKDIPLFEDGYDETQDSFNHKVYSDTLVKLIESNDPPLSIGLFGPWGCGKSSILNTAKIDLEGRNFLCVYFNAWKYAGDSFRRQFLLNTIRSVYSPDEAEAAKKKLIRRFYNEIPIAESKLEKIFEKMQKVSPKIHIGPLGFSIPLLKTDPKLVLPEQFEDEFKAMLNINILAEKKNNKTAKKIKGKKFLFIIDDIDRCPPDMVVTILDSVKTFLTPKQSNCYFILALDDKAVVSVLSKINENYSDEELLKFFDVTVRMNPLKRYDLVSFANKIADITNLPKNVIQTAVYGEFDSPRKIKHFLNVFLVRSATMAKRHVEGFLVDMPDPNQLSKLLVIEIKFPQIFRKMIDDPNLIKTLQDYSEDFSLGKQDKIPEEYKLNARLFKFLWQTRNINIDDPELIIFQKLSQFANILKQDEVQINKLSEAILNYSLEELIELTQPIQSAQSRKALVGFLKEKLDISTGIFLDNSTESSLFIFKNLEMSESSRTELADTILQNYLQAKTDVFDLHNFESLLGCIDTTTQKKQQIGNIKKLGLSLLGEREDWEEIKNEYLLNVAKFINYLFSKNRVDIRTANQINTILKSWIGNVEQLLEVLEHIELTEDQYKKQAEKNINVPGHDVLKQLIERISTNDDEVSIYERIRNIIFKFWQKENIEPLDEKLSQILETNVPKVSTITPTVRFVFETIIYMPTWLDDKFSSPIADQIWNFYTKCSNMDDKTTKINQF